VNRITRLAVVIVLLLVVAGLIITTLPTPAR
jgi:hypothetical protein